MDTRIYVMTHRKFEPPQPEYYIPLHVGKSGKEDLNYTGDDTGDTISEKNDTFCELTGLYWIWKNVRCDVAGVCHYRRYFVRRGSQDEPGPLGQKLLNRDSIERCLQTYDMIVPDSGMTQEGSVWNQYALRHRISDWMECGKIIHELCPEYDPAYQWSQNCNFVSLGNMVITRKEILDEYCEWLFRILFEAERRIDTSGYDAYQRRIFGFLSERLFRVWLLKQPLRIREEPVLLTG